MERNPWILDRVEHAWLPGPRHGLQSTLEKLCVSSMDIEPVFLLVVRIVWNHAGDQGDDDLAAGAAYFTPLKQTTNQPKVTQPRDLPLARVILFLDQAANHQATTVGQYHIGFDVSRLFLGQSLGVNAT